ncbi:MAG: alpha/beta hydrolase [Halieaceae bacterium]|jgi:acetyl esterase|nr:alpha/beta hydrolase [Halieaceae bacterium]
MPLDPHSKGLLEALQAQGLKSFEQMSVAEARGAIETFVGLQAAPQEVKQIIERTIEGEGGPLKLRIYVPDVDGPLPVLVYYHGGGWVGGSLAVVDEPCRALANRNGVIVVAATYRLAPEARFPAASHDAYTILSWASKNAVEFGGDAARLGVIGDSAGGNLAAVAALMARDRGTPPVKAQILTYPVIQRDGDFASREENSEGYLLHTAAIAWFWEQYLAQDEDANDPYASPIMAKSLAGLPPALIMTVEFDPARDEGESFGRALEAAGVPVTVRRFDGLIHGVYWTSGAIPRSVELHEAIEDFVGRYLK